MKFEFDIDEQEREDLRQVLYEKIKKTDEEIERQKRLADRLNLILLRLDALKKIKMPHSNG